VVRVAWGTEDLAKGDLRTMNGPNTPNIASVKLDAKISWVDPDGQQHGPYLSLIHLFEHRYDHNMTFWYGAAGVASASQDIDEQMAPMAPRGPIVIEFEDGRRAEALVTTTVPRIDDHGVHPLLYFYCVTDVATT
jgi:hypothetical protein